MTEKNFSRARSSDSDRKFGEAPILGRLSRSPVSAMKGGGRRRKRLKQKTKVSRAVVTWTLTISFVVLAALIVFLVGYFRNKAEEAIEAANLDEFARDFAIAFSEQKTVELPSLDKTEALAIVHAAFANRDPDAIVGYFVLGETTDPSEALSDLKEISKNEGEISDYQWLGQKFVNGQVIGQMLVEFGNGERRVDRLAELIMCADSKWRIDLDSYLRKSSPGWDAILSGKSETSVIRIFVAIDTYYNGIYSDDTQWQAFSLGSPDVEHNMYGYAKRDSPQIRALRKILGSGEKVHRATVEIRLHPDAGSRQFEISGVLAENWVLGKIPFDESF